MAAPRRVGKEKWSAKNDTWTDRNGVVTEGMSAKGFKRGTAKGLLASDISGLVEVREDNREAIANAIDRALVAALEEVGLVAEGYAKATCPVDTGRLRNSVTHLLKGYDCFIGTNVEYAPYVEEGTSRMKGKHFLRKAATGHGDAYRAILEKHLRGGA